MRLIEKLKMKWFMKIIKQDEFKIKAYEELLADKVLVEGLRIEDIPERGGERMVFTGDVILYKSVISNSIIETKSMIPIHEFMLKNNIFKEKN